MARMNATALALQKRGFEPPFNAGLEPPAFTNWIGLELPAFTPAFTH